MTTRPRSALQLRTLGTLGAAQVLGGVGLSAGVAVGSLLAEQVSGSATYAGLGGTFQVLGAALIAVPMARLMAARGRRPGLVLGYALAVVGAVGLITAGIVGSFALLLAASVLFGGATASNSQARYAAADLAQPAHRGRDLSIVVWATTIGSVLGPNLVGPAEPVARALHIPALAGPFVFSVAGLLAAIVLIGLRLRPDPLLEARRIAVVANPGASVARPHGSVVRGLGVIAGSRLATLGVLTQALGHTVMVSVMVMTPLYMHDGHAELTVIGLVISIHIVGMYAFSPFTGIAVDRFGGRAIAFLGAAVLGASAILASTAPMGASTVLMVALLLLGMGWSCTLVSGSAMLTAAIPIAERAGAQGASDLVMGLAAAGGGGLAGVVVDHLGYHTLALGALALAAVIAVAAFVLGERQPDAAQPDSDRVGAHAGREGES